MRNTSESERGAWATYAKAARTGLAMSQAELARRLDVDRVTIWRWETGKQRPEDLATVQSFARVLELDLDEALAAAGLKLDTEPPSEPTREADPEMEEILASRLPDRVKAELIEHLAGVRERDQQRRLEDLRRMIRLARGSA